MRVEHHHSLPTQTGGKLGTFQPVSKDDLSYSLDTVAQVSRNDSSHTDAESTQLQVFERYTAHLYAEKEKLIERQKAKAKWVKKLHNLGLVEMASNLERCHSDFASMLMCKNKHKYKAIVAYQCYLPFCPDCVSKKAYRNIRTQLPKFFTYLLDHPDAIVALMTLTIRSVRDRSPAAGFKILRTKFRNLRNYPTYKHISSEMLGGVFACEATYSKFHRWHPHLHSVVLLRNYIPQKALSDAWSKLNKDGSKIVDIREVSDLAKGILECIKYPFKPADVDNLGKREILEMMDLKGKRLSDSFGKLYGLKTDEISDPFSDFMKSTWDLKQGDNCPVCWMPVVKYFNVPRANYVKVLPPAITSPKRE